MSQENVERLRTGVELFLAGTSELDARYMSHSEALEAVGME